MSRRTLGIVLLLGASALLGIVAGHRFYLLFLKTVPPLLIGDFTRGAAHLNFLAYGFVLGVMIFLWSLLAVFLSRFFGTTDPKTAAAPAR